MVNHQKVAIRMPETEIFQTSSELVMVIHPNASKWQWMLVINTLVCNIEENVGEVTLWANTARDQTVSAI